MAKKRKGERPDGLIQVALDVGHWPDGRRKRKYFYGHTRAEANAKKLAYKTYVQVGSIDREKITVGEWVTIFKDTYRQGIDEAYLKGDDRPYDRLIEALGDMRMKVVTESDLQAVLNQTKGMSFSTCDKYRQAACSGAQSKTASSTMTQPTTCGCRHIPRAATGHWRHGKFRISSPIGMNRASMRASG